MIKGIIIGILIWQVVVFILHWLEMEDSPLTTPIPFCCMKMVIVIDTSVKVLADWQAYLFLIKMGFNPFSIKISDLLALTDEQKTMLIDKTKNKTVKRNLINLFKKNS